MDQRANATAGALSRASFLRTVAEGASHEEMPSWTNRTTLSFEVTSSPSAFAESERPLRVTATLR